MKAETIQIEKIRGVNTSLFALNWNVEQLIGEIQHYSCGSMFSDSREHGAVIDNIHIRMPENEIGIIIPFTESEKSCWECGGQRMLELKINIDCFCMTWFDWCYNPQHERVKK